MGTSRQQDRSLNSGISLPQWMKGKMDNKFDFDESAFSPPSHDDTFFYIRYPKSQNSETQQGFKPITEILNESGINSTTSTSTTQMTNHKTIPDFKEVKEMDFSKHPLPCQPFIQTVNNKAVDGGTRKTPVSGTTKSKSQGTDDGFHGEPALCGKSIVDVANQMMTSKFTKIFAPESRSQSQMESPMKNVSKSLPATPLTSPTGTPDSSPKMRRKVHSNRYFTGAFVPDREKYQGSWILAGMLGQSREIVTTKIEEEDEPLVDLEPHKPLDRKKSISSQNLTYVGKDEKAVDKSLGYANVFEAKPSELREMNFWSPTSM